MSAGNRSICSLFVLGALCVVPGTLFVLFSKVPSEATDRAMEPLRVGGV
jgi:hypothetical protein